MAKRLQEYVKYTTKELESYIATEGSCVKKINTNLHLSIGPYALSNFKKAILNHITQTKIGFYNIQLDGIVLDIKNIKVLQNACAIRFDDPKVHVNINADCYVFRPSTGAVLTGIVKYIGTKHVGTIIYRVFNATIRFANTIDEDEVEMDKEIKFRIKNFNLQNVFPYIEGELLTESNAKVSKHATTIQIDEIKEENNDNTNNHDSGIEEKSINGLDEIPLIKHEISSEIEEISSTIKKNKSSKRKHKSADISIVSDGTSQKADISVKEETTTPKKKKKMSQDEISIKEEITTPKKKKKIKNLNLSVKEEMST